MNPRGVFITGTDTEVGKTYISAALARSIADTHTPIVVRKPVASGAALQNGALVSEDTALLIDASNSTEPPSVITPYVFAEPVTPALAARLNGQPLSMRDIINACALPEIPKNTPNNAPTPFLLVEGAGGVFSPLADDGHNNGHNIDLMVALNLPAIVVVANRLGCINHAALTLAALREAGIPIRAVVLNHTSQATGTDASIPYNAAAIRALAERTSGRLSCPFYETPFVADWRELVPYVAPIANLPSTAHTPSKRTTL